MIALQAQREPEPADDSHHHFEHVVATLAEIDWDQIWSAATDTERRTVLDEFIAQVDVYPDHLEVEVRGAGKLNVALHEVGLRSRSVETSCVEGGT